MNPRPLVIYALLISAAFLVSPWFLVGAAGWFFVFEVLELNRRL